jgi:hypothetical protein
VYNDDSTGTQALTYSAVNGRPLSLQPVNHVLSLHIFSISELYSCMKLNIKTNGEVGRNIIWGENNYLFLTELTD